MRLIIELELESLTYESERFEEGLQKLIAGFKVQEVLTGVANKINGRTLDATDSGRIGPWPRPWDTERIGTWSLEA